MPPTLRSASDQGTGHLPPVPGSPSPLRTWLFDAETSDDSGSDAFCLNPPSTTSTTSTKPGSELETIRDSDCELDCSTPTPGPISTHGHLGLGVTKPETKSNREPCSSPILSLAKLADDLEQPNTPGPETPILDLGPEPANPELRGLPFRTEVDSALFHKIRALKHYAHWSYRQIATATGVALSTVYRMAHPPLTPIHSRLRGCHSILRTPQREKLIALATSSAENHRKSYTEIAQMAGLTACNRTLRRTMSSAGYHRRVARKKPYISIKTRQVRVSFRQFIFKLLSYYKVQQEVMKQLLEVDQSNIFLVCFS